MAHPNLQCVKTKEELTKRATCLRRAYVFSIFSFALEAYRHTRGANMKLLRSNLVAIGLLSILILFLCYHFWIGNQNVKPPVMTQNPTNAALNKKQPVAAAVQPSSVSQSSVSTSASGGSVGRPPISYPGRIDKVVALDSLKKWIKQKEGRNVEVVDAQTAYDMNGTPTDLNVLVTSRSDSGLTPETLKEQLTAINAQERNLHEQLTNSYQKGDIAAVNQLVASLSEARTSFVASNEVTTYKISLSTNNPPILSFWPGLPFETVREEECRILAARELGVDVGLQGLIHYTSATSLLCFTNNSGGSFYVDPFRLAAVPASALMSTHARTPRADDDGRNSRIAQQWVEFLRP